MHHEFTGVRENSNAMKYSIAIWLLPRIGFYLGLFRASLGPQASYGTITDDLSLRILNMLLIEMESEICISTEISLKKLFW